MFIEQVLLVKDHTIYELVIPIEKCFLEITKANKKYQDTLKDTMGRTF